MIRIRIAKLSDLEDVFRLHKQLYEFECKFDANLNKTYYETEEAKTKVFKIIKNRRKLCLVLEKDNKIVGVADGYMIDCDFYIKKVGYLDHLCIDENFRRTGLGKMLINAFEKKMKARGAEYIKLNAFAANSSAILFYKNANFKRYSTYYMKRT